MYPLVKLTTVINVLMTIIKNVSIVRPGISETVVTPVPISVIHVPAHLNVLIVPPVPTEKDKEKVIYVLVPPDSSPKKIPTIKKSYNVENVKTNVKPVKTVQITVLNVL